MFVQTIDNCIEEDGTLIVSGRTEHGKSIMMNVYGFKAYFYIHFVPLANSATNESEVFIYEKFIHDINERFRWELPFLAKEKAMKRYTCGQGYQNNLQKTMFRIEFPSISQHRTLLWKLKDSQQKKDLLLELGLLSFCQDLVLYDVDTDVLVKALSVTGMRSMGWINISDLDEDTLAKYQSPDPRVDFVIPVTFLSDLQNQPFGSTYCHFISPIVRDALNQHIRVLSFDFETFSSEGAFPDPLLPGDEIYQASMIFRSLNQNPNQSKRYGASTANFSSHGYLLHLFEMQPHDPILDTSGIGTATIFIKCKNEKHLLNMYISIIKHENPDVLTGHNIDGFDHHFFFTRCSFRNIPLVDFSRISKKPCFTKMNEFKSGQVAAIKRFQLTCPGRLNEDFQIWIERNMAPNKYENYKLETIAQTELKEGKDGVSVPYMMDAYRTKDPIKLGIVGRYCVIDSCLVDRLVDKLNMVIQTAAMSNCVNVPASYLLEKGQTVRLNAMLAEESYRQNIRLPYIQNESDHFEGAWVLDIVKGCHKNVACTDFNSLYPSIMIQHSICITTIVNDPKYLNIPGVTYETIKWDCRVYYKLDRETKSVKRKHKSFAAALEDYCFENPKIIQLLQTVHQVIIPKLKSALRKITTTIMVDDLEFSLTDYIDYQLFLPCMKDIIYGLRKIALFLGNSSLKSHCLELAKQLRFLQMESKYKFASLLGLQANEELALLDMSMEEEEEMDNQVESIRKAMNKIKFSNALKTNSTWTTKFETQSFVYASNVPCLTKNILNYLIAARKKVRKAQKLLAGSKLPDDIIQYQVYEAQQLAFKVVANSIYGGLSLRDWRLGASVTGQGRNMLIKVRDTAENELSEYLQQNHWTEEEANSRIFEGEKDLSPLIPLYPTAIAGKPYSDRPVKIKAIGGDTDSVFIRFEDSSIEEGISWGHKAAELFTSKFGSQINMEFEKLWNPYYAIAMKKGIGRKYVHSPKLWEMELKGVETKRRNYCQAIKTTLLQVYRFMLEDSQNGPLLALNFIENFLWKLLRSEIPLDQFLISTKVKSSYKQAKNAGLDLVQRMKARGDYETPAIGTRFQFIYVNRPGQQHTRSESLEYAKEHNLQIDMLYYLNKQISHPLEVFMEAAGYGKELAKILKIINARASALSSRLQCIDNVLKRKSSDPNPTELSLEVQPASGTMGFPQDRTNTMKKPRVLKQSCLNFAKFK